MHFIWGVGTSEMAGAGLGLEVRVVAVIVALPDPGLLLLRQDAAVVPAQLQYQQLTLVFAIMMQPWCLHNLVPEHRFAFTVEWV